MKIQMVAKPLAQALALLASAAAKRADPAILSHVLIEARDGGEVDLTATDLDSFVSLRLAATVEEPGACCVPASAFRDACKKLERGAHVELAAIDGKMRMDSGRARLTFPTMPAGDFPSPRHLVENCEAVETWDMETSEPTQLAATRAPGLEPVESALKVLAKFAKHCGFGVATLARYDAAGDRHPRLVVMRENAVFGCIIAEPDEAAKQAKPSPFNLDAGLFVEIDGERVDVATRASGEIALTAAQVAAMCGPVDPSTFVRIPDVVFHRGRMVAVDGIATDGSGRRFIGQRTKGRKVYCLSNAEFEAAWAPAEDVAPLPVEEAAPADICAGPLCKGVPWPEVLEEAAIASGFGLEMCDDVVSVVNWGREGKFRTRIPARHQSRARELFEQQARDYAASLKTPQDAPEAVEAVPTPSTTENALSEPLAQDEATNPVTPTPAPAETDPHGLEAAGEMIGALIAELQARVARLEAAVTEPDAQSGIIPAVETSHAKTESQGFTRERRLRIVRRYVAMRAQRDLDRRALDAGNDYTRTVETRAQEAEQRMRGLEMRAERAEFELSDMSGQLTAATERADTADAKWSALIDAKQARIVTLENEKLERLSGGRIVMPGYGKVAVRPALVAVGR